MSQEQLLIPSSGTLQWGVVEKLGGTMFPLFGAVATWTTLLSQDLRFLKLHFAPEQEINLESPQRVTSFVSFLMAMSQSQSQPMPLVFAACKIEDSVSSTSDAQAGKDIQYFLKLLLATRL
jgi:hypothetical protein